MPAHLIGVTKIPALAPARFNDAIKYVIDNEVSQRSRKVILKSTAQTHQPRFASPPIARISRHHKPESCAY